MPDITITEGNTLEVDYEIENTGDGTGDQDADLFVQSVLEDTDANIVLDPAQTATGTLQWPTEDGDAVTDALAEAVTDDTSDSITVTVENAIPDNVVDNFELGPDGVYADTETIADFYSGETQQYEITSNSALEGDRSLETTAADPRLIISHPGDGLNNYPSQGDTILFQYKGADFDTSDPPVDGVYFGVSPDESQFYYFQIDGNEDHIALYKNGVNTPLSTSSVTLANIEYTGKVDWNDSNESEITCELYDNQDNLEASLTVQESELTSEGFGFRTFIFGPTSPIRRFDLVKSGNITYP